MKKVLRICLSFLLLLALVACSTSQVEQEPEEPTVDLYTPGSYTGKSSGYGGEVTVTITVDTDSITDVELTGNDETESIGKVALEELKQQILSAQNTEFDGVSGATVTSDAIKYALEDALNQATGNSSDTASSLTDGTYSASSTGYSWTGMVYGDVKIEDNAIVDITITQEHETETGEMANTAFDLMIPRIIEHQSIAVDSVTGATSTSNAIKNIVSQAITQAGGNPSDWMKEVEKNSDVVVLEDFDVIVVGLGGSGTLAYAAAADNGASVFGIEASAKLGGQSATTTGPMIIGTENEAFTEAEFPELDELYETWIEYVESEEKADIIYEAVYNNGTYIDYFIDNYEFEFAGTIMSFAIPSWTALWTRYTGETSNLFGANKTFQYDRAMDLAVAKNEKNDYQLELRATELIIDNDIIEGVKAISYDGTQYEVYGDTVILATGGFVGNPDMLNEYFGTNVNTVASTLSDGTGINMGLSAGGTTYNIGVDPMMHILEVPNMIKNDDLTPDQKSILSALALVTGETSVDINGQLLDQSLTGTTTISSIPGYRYYNVYTEEQILNYQENGLTENFERAVGHFTKQGGSFEVNTPVSDIFEILEVGQEYRNVLKADSIAELAELMGCDEANLKETLNNEETTYYAVIVVGYSYGTVGGLDVDVNMNVLRADGTPIENLFAVGQDSMGVANVEGKPYTPWGGQAQSWTFVSGYLAGNAAAEYGLSK